MASGKGTSFRFLFTLQSNPVLAYLLEIWQLWSDTSQALPTYTSVIGIARRDAEEEEEQEQYLTDNIQYSQPTSIQSP